MTANQFVKPTSLPGLFVLERPTFTDNRGFFREVFHLNELEDVLGYSFHPVQWNHSRSLPNVIRAFHAENWNKLVYPVSGEIFNGNENFTRYWVDQFIPVHPGLTCRELE